MEKKESIKEETDQMLGSIDKTLLLKLLDALIEEQDSK